MELLRLWFASFSCNVLHFLNFAVPYNLCIAETDRDFGLSGATLSAILFYLQSSLLVACIVLLRRRSRLCRLFSVPLGNANTVISLFLSSLLTKTVIGFVLLSEQFSLFLIFRFVFCFPNRVGLMLHSIPPPHDFLLGFSDSPLHGSLPLFQFVLLLVFLGIVFFERIPHPLKVWAKVMTFDNSHHTNQLQNHIPLPF